MQRMLRSLLFHDALLHCTYSIMGAAPCSQQRRSGTTKSYSFSSLATDGLTKQYIIFTYTESNDANDQFLSVSMLLYLK